MKFKNILKKKVKDVKIKIKNIIGLSENKKNNKSHKKYIVTKEQLEIPKKKINIDTEGIKKARENSNKIVNLMGMGK